MPVFGLVLLIGESSSDKSLEELENPSEDGHPKLSFESLRCALQLELSIRMKAFAFHRMGPGARRQPWPGLEVFPE